MGEETEAQREEEVAQDRFQSPDCLLISPAPPAHPEPTVQPLDSKGQAQDI